jgi:hypothetical protein
MQDDDILILAGCVLVALLLVFVSTDFMLAGPPLPVEHGEVVAKSYAPSGHKTSAKWVVVVRIDGASEAFTVDSRQWDAVEVGQRITLPGGTPGRWTGIRYGRGF